MTLQTRRYGRTSRGITLLEVLVAMLVMTVGLLGMAAMIPLGRLELAEANVADNAATLGRSAFRDLMVRGFLNPENWANPITGDSVIRTAGGSGDPATALVPGAPPAERQFEVDSRLMRPPFVPIVIDPLMLSPNNPEGLAVPNSDSDAETPHREICLTFPYSLRIGGQSTGLPEAVSTVPLIPRVTLRTYPLTVTGAARTLKYTMRYDLASRIFRSTDDLVFGEPRDLKRRPIQQFTQDYGQANAYSLNVIPIDGQGTSTMVSSAGYRKFSGAYSWFVVAEPSMSEAYSPATAQMTPAVGGPGASVMSARQFRYWVVVCHQRDLRRLPDDTIRLPGEQGLGERMVWVDLLDRNTARLRVAGLRSEAAAARALDIKANQWFAIVGRYEERALTGLDPGPGLANMRYVMEWYRVTGVAERPQVDKGDTWYREVTIVGRDFGGLGFSFIDESDYAYEDLKQSMGDIQPQTGFGILVRGARAVYEKSLHLDRATLWSM